MNTEERNQILSQFIDYLDANSASQQAISTQEINQLDLSQQNLPRLDVVQELMTYHKDITHTIGSTYKEVRGVMVHMKSLKDRKKNVQLAIDSMTACQQIKRLSFGLGAQPREVLNNLHNYYTMKNKVHHMDKYFARIQGQIVQLEQEYQTIFDTQINKNNSNSISDISKVLSLIQSHTQHTQENSRPDALGRITDLCLAAAKKEFGVIEEELFRIPIVGGEQSNFKFFDLAKLGMKTIASLSTNCKQNVSKVSGEPGYIHVIQSLFEKLTNGIIFELLMRLKKYYDIDKIVITQTKFVLKQREFKQLQPYFKEYVAIWNQLERLRLHLLTEINDNSSQKQQLKTNLEHALNNTQLVQINASAIIFMQTMMRFRFDKLLKTSRFVGCICSFQNDFFRQINDKNISHNTAVQDFLEQTMNRTCEGVEKALQTLNTMIISAIINFTNHNLIYEDVFYAFNQLFSRVFSKLPSSQTKIQQAMILTLNAITAFPRALKMLLHIKLPEEVPERRIKAQLQQVVHNNEDKTFKVLQGMIARLVGAEWFRYELQKDYQHILEKWMGLETDCFHLLIQSVCRVHAQMTEQTQFSKKYSQVNAIAFEKEIRAIISFYERYSHSILPHFKRILDYIEVLQLQSEDDFRDIVVRFKGVHNDSDLRRVWALRT